MTFLQLALRLHHRPRAGERCCSFPAYFRGDLFTSYELLQRRFGTRSRRWRRAIFLITRSLADGIRLFATALVIAVVTGVPVTWTVVLLGAAMIVYTVRGGVVGGDLDGRRADVRVYRRRGRGVRRAAARIPGGWAEVVGGRTGGGKFTMLDLLVRSEGDLYALGRPARRHRAHAGDARHRSVPGAAPALRAVGSARRSVGLILSGVIVFAQFVLFLLSA